MRLTISDIIEEDDERVLFGAVDAQQNRKTFHLVKDKNVDEMIDRVERGERVDVDL